jgi:hypothetical protein
MKNLISIINTLSCRDAVLYLYIAIHYLKNSYLKYEKILFVFSLCLLINWLSIYEGYIGFIAIITTSIFLLLTIFMTKKIVMIIYSSLLLYGCLSQLIISIFTFSYIVLNSLLVLNCIIALYLYISESKKNTKSIDN